jgi:hypothetical protein
MVHMTISPDQAALIVPQMASAGQYELASRGMSIWGILGGVATHDTPKKMPCTWGEVMRRRGLVARHACQVCPNGKRTPCRKSTLDDADRPW